MSARAARTLRRVSSMRSWRSSTRRAPRRAAIGAPAGRRGGTAWSALTARRRAKDVVVARPADSRRRAARRLLRRPTAARRSAGISYEPAAELRRDTQAFKAAVGALARADIAREPQVGSSACRGEHRRVLLGAARSPPPTRRARVAWDDSRHLPHRLHQPRVASASTSTSRRRPPSRRRSAGASGHGARPRALSNALVDGRAACEGAARATAAAARSRSAVAVRSAPQCLQAIRERFGRAGGNHGEVAGDRRPADLTVPAAFSLTRHLHRRRRRRSHADAASHAR